jgi:pyridoxine kinase
MARVLAISSQVVRGHVGLSAAVPALQRLGHEVWPLPTVILSNHPGHPHAAVQRIAPGTLAELIDALERNGWLAEVDAVLTGYLPSADHVRVAAQVVRRLRTVRPVYYLCDPVLGDDPKGIYIDPDAACAIRDELTGLADALTPNRFELGWLSGEAVPAGSAEAWDITRAVRACTDQSVVVTSAAREGDRLVSLVFGQGAAHRIEVAWRPNVPHGTGDMLAALFLGHRLNGHSDPAALAHAAAGVEQAILASEGRDELAMVASQDAWANATPLPLQPLSLADNAI